ncbi:hypothetical protein C8J57DRAFT_1068632, partial [Mycena rebaudengoi]
MVVGGMTQYLAKVQGMPTEVEAKLEKRIRKFLWGEKTNVTINKETVYAPIDMGGRNLLDIVARNEAITVTWLKSYLSFGDDRPLWAFVADEILALKVPIADLTVDKGMRRNMYLQKWRTNLSELKKDSKDLANLIKVAQKHELRMDGIAISRQIQRDMPIWYHIKSTARSRGIYSSGEQVECLKENHGVRTV